MALLFADGFDLYFTLQSIIDAGWVKGGSGDYADMYLSLGRFGGGTIGLGNNNSIHRYISSTGNEIGVQAALKMDDLDPENVLLRVDNNSQSDLCFQIHVLSNGSIRLRDSANSIVATSGAGVIVTGVWYYLEVWATIADSGDVLLKLNGETILNESSVDTSISATNVDKVTFYAGTAATGNRTYWDDIIILDGSGSINNDLLGDCRIATLLPNADTAQEDWDLSTGSDSYDLINDTIPGIHDEDSTYIEEDTVGNETRCEFENSPSDAASIKAVVLSTALRKTDAGQRTARGLINSNGTESVGATRYPSTDYQTYRDIYETNPDGGGAWSKSAVDALEAGVEVVA